MFNKKLHKIIEDQNETIQELHRQLAQSQSWYQDALDKLYKLRHETNLKTKGKFIVFPELSRGKVSFLVMKLGEYGDYSQVSSFNTLEDAEEAVKVLLTGPKYYGVIK